MTVDLGGGYLSGLPEDQRDELARVNGPGLAALREYLDSGAAVAFLGAGASRPLYPLWDGLIGQLLDAAAGRLTAKEEATCRAPRKARRGTGSGGCWMARCARCWPAPASCVTAGWWC